MILTFMKRNFLSLAAITAILLIMVSGSVSAAWTSNTVDGLKTFPYLSSRSIAIEKMTGIRHVAYGGDHLYHAYFDGTQWHHQLIDNSPGVGAEATIAVDINNKTHIVYYDWPNKALKYATNASGSWVKRILDKDSVGQKSSIAVDLAGKVHISYAYFDWANSPNPFFPDTGLKYTTNTSGLWVTSIIESGGSAGRTSSITTDKNNKVHISYTGPNGELKYANDASGLWDTSVIDDSGMGSYSAIIVNTNNKVFT